MDVVIYLLLTVVALFLLILIMLVCSIMGKLDSMEHTLNGLHRGLKLMRDHQYKRDLREASASGAHENVEIKVNPFVAEDLGGHMARYAEMERRRNMRHGGR